MSEYQWLRDNLFCLASLAEFKGQPEVSEGLMQLYYEVAFGRAKASNSLLENEFDVIDPNVNVVPFCLNREISCQ